MPASSLLLPPGLGKRRKGPAQCEDSVDNCVSHQQLHGRAPLGFPNYTEAGPPMAYRCAPKTLCINNLIWDYRFRPDALAEALRFYKNALNRVKNKTHD